MLDRQQTVANLVVDHSECAEVFKRHRIDFCCHGDVSIEAAAKAQGIDVDALAGELSRAIEERRGASTDDAAKLSTPDLIDRIVSKHHAYLRKTLPFVCQLAAKVSRVHGDHNPKLRELAPMVDELAETLIPHLDEEERAMFPLLAGPEPPRAKAAEMLASMFDDHVAVSKLLERIRASADDFTVPEWGCGSYRTLFSELRQIEGDLFVHVHLENHVLRPRFT